MKENLIQSDDERFAIAHAFTAKWEGGLSDCPNDSGGVTNYGASLEYVRDLARLGKSRALLERLGIELPIERETILALKPEQAAAMFRYSFWRGLEYISLSVAVALYDTRVNCGAKTAVIMAQNAWNSLHDSKITVDGKIGPESTACFNMSAPRLRWALLDARETYYKRICEKKPSQRVFLKGWLARVADLRKYLEQI